MRETLEVLYRLLVVQHQLALPEVPRPEPTLHRLAQHYVLLLHLLDEGYELGGLRPSYPVSEAELVQRE